jgi:hypothetical protein
MTTNSNEYDMHHKRWERNYRDQMNWKEYRTDYFPTNVKKDVKIVKIVKNDQPVKEFENPNLGVKYLKRINKFLSHTTDDWRGFYKLVTGYTTRKLPEDILLELIYDFIQFRNHIKR